MLRVYRSETEQYLVVHEPTGSVVLADTFDEAHAQLTSRLGDRFDRDSAAPGAAAPSAPAARLGSPLNLALVALVVVLPFIWLGVLHASLGGLIVELRRSVHDSTQESGADAQEVAALRDRVDGLTAQVERLTKGQARPKPPVKRTSAASKADDGDEEDEDEDEDEDDGQDPEAEGKSPAPARALVVGTPTEDP